MLLLDKVNYLLAWRFRWYLHRLRTLKIYYKHRLTGQSKMPGRIFQKFLPANQSNGSKLLYEAKIAQPLVRQDESHFVTWKLWKNALKISFLYYFKHERFWKCLFQSIDLHHSNVTKRCSFLCTLLLMKSIFVTTYDAFMQNTKAEHQQHVNCLINTFFCKLKHGC